MKKRICLTGLLIAAMALLPYRPARAQQVQPRLAVEVVCGMVVIGVGIWITFSIYKVCKKIPAPPKDDQDPEPQPPPPAPAPRAKLATPSQALALDDQSGVLYWDCSTNNWTDPVSGTPITSIMKTQIQSSPDLSHWSEEVSLLGYCSDSGILVIFSRAGSPVCTNYLPLSATNVVDLGMGDGLSPQKFFRLKAG